MKAINLEQFISLIINEEMLGIIDVLTIQQAAEHLGAQSMAYQINIPPFLDDDGMERWISSRCNFDKEASQYIVIWTSDIAHPVRDFLLVQYGKSIDDFAEDIRRLIQLKMLW